MSLKSYIQFLNEEAKFSTSWVLEHALNEGGAYGHLNHPFEDMELTMQDLKGMIETTIEGAFGPENFVQEKTDGQNIMISWKNGQLIAARNKGHLKNAGENAMTKDSLAQFFAGRGNIEEAFTTAMDDLSSAIASLSDSDRTRFFAEGKKFASVEVITPITQNTVPYGQNMLVFHGMVEYDADGIAIGEDKQSGRDIGQLIADANAAAQKMFYVRGPQDIASTPFPNTSARASYYQAKLQNVMDESGTTLTSTVEDYVLGMGKTILAEEASKAGVTVDDTVLGRLVRRIAMADKSFTSAEIKRSVTPETANWYNNLEKTRGMEIKRRIFAPLENLFLEIGTEMMKNIRAFLSANPTEAAAEMKREIEAVIASVRTNGDEKDVEKLEHELSRIAAAGGLESIVPTEGITFVYNGKLYKYTGIFAPLNQIRGILAYKK